MGLHRGFAPRLEPLDKPSGHAVGEEKATGNLEGFPVLNTAAVQVGWKNDGKGGESPSASRSTTPCGSRPGSTPSW